MPVIMDFPTAWAFTKASKDEDHDSRCSWVRARLLCDCHVIWDEYERRKDPEYRRRADSMGATHTDSGQEP